MTIKPISESDFQSQIMELAVYCGYRVHHQRPAKTSQGWRTAISGDKGFPDLVLAKPGVLLVPELKRSAKEKPSDDQQLWMAAIHGNRAISECWRPEDWSRIQELIMTNGVSHQWTK